MTMRFKPADRRFFVGGSDARIITGEDEGAESDAADRIPTQAGQRSDDCGQPIRVG